MKLLTKNSDYAVGALVVLAKNKDKFLSAREIAGRQKIPYQFLRRILQELIRNKLVVSREGGSGGFKINADPKKVSIIDVIKVFQGNVRISDCMFRRQICQNRSNCILRKEMKRVERIIAEEFKGITLERLLKTHQ